MQTFKISKALEAKEFTFPKVIGLTGPKGIGKSTFANRVGGVILSLSSPIKEMLSVIVDKKYLYEDKEVQIPGFPEGLNGRRLLQTLGTEWGRNLYSSIWLDATHDKIANLVAQASVTDNQFLRVIVDDIRFKNEANMIKELGGEVWRIKRVGFVPLEDDHSSEEGLSDEYINKEIIVNE
jgi:translation initiation factor RLI1